MVVVGGGGKNTREISFIHFITELLPLLAGWLRVKSHLVMEHWAINKLHAMRGVVVAIHECSLDAATAVKGICHFRRGKRRDLMDPLVPVRPFHNPNSACWCRLFLSLCIN